MSLLPYLLPSLGLLIPLLSAVLTTIAVNALKRVSVAFDDAPAVAKQGVAFIIACVVVVMANALGVTVAAQDPEAWAGQVPPETVQAILSALLSHVLHAGARIDARRSHVPHTSRGER
jgi:hypothetical protein